MVESRGRNLGAKSRGWNLVKNLAKTLDSTLNSALDSTLDSANA